MLHTVFNLTRPLIVFDLETTSSKPEEARICELGFQRFTDQGLDKEWRGLINPTIPIPRYLTEHVHKISDDDVRDSPKFVQLAPNIARGFSDCDFAGKNIRYDLKVLAAEMKRACVNWNYAGAHIICADRIEQVGEPRDLTALYKRRTGKDLVDAHSALNDVRATAELIVSQLAQWFQHLPRDVEALHRQLWPDWIDTDGFFRFKQDEPVIAFGKHRDVSLRKVPADYLKWIVGADFPDDVKQIASNALTGRYPTKD